MKLDWRTNGETKREVADSGGGEEGVSWPADAIGDEPTLAVVAEAAGRSGTGLWRPHRPIRDSAMVKST